MLYNYLKIALRTLHKHRAYSLLNILGLGLTVACCLIIFLLVQYQTGFDRFHPDAERTGRVVTELHLENIRYSSGVPYPMAAALRQEFPYIRKAATVDGYSEVLVTVPGAAGAPAVLFKEENTVAYAEPAIFDILHFPLLNGSLAEFAAPNTALITEKTARKYFGTADAVGRHFLAFDSTNFQVVGILRDMPDNTDCGREVFCSWATLQNNPKNAYIESWGGIRGNTRCYVALQPGHTLAELAVALPAFSAKFPHPVRKELFAYQAYSLADLHFDNRYDGTFDRRYLWVLSCIGLFLLLTACVNFVNMATAQSLTRVREVGVRKSLGSTRGQLFRQFLFETGVLVLLAFLAGLFFARQALPSLNAWTGQHLQFAGLFQPAALLFSLALGVLLVLLAGVYPGLVLARFQPVQSLKGQVTGQQAGSAVLRRGLVATQFAIAQVLIIAAVVVTLQMRYALDSDWGFRREALVTVPLPDAGKADVLKQQISRIPGLRSLSFCSAPPAHGSSNQTFFKYENRGEPEKWAVTFLWGDENYLGTFGLQLAAGRNVDPANPQAQCLVNETFVRRLNLGAAAGVVGTSIRIEDKPILIAGVLRDFHTGSFRESIPPLMVQLDAKSYSLCALSLGKGNPAAALQQVGSVWKNLFPGSFYEYQFLDEQLAGFYTTETRMLRFVQLFSGLAIFIACLGLFGLTAFMVARKTKEIGVRKVLGATVPGILWLLGKEYLRLIGIAFLVAAPFGWWAMQAWLSDFAYRIDLQGWMLALAGAAVVAVAGLTVGVQSVRAALAKPVTTLRNE